MEKDRIEEENNVFIDEQLTIELGRTPNTEELQKVDLRINPVTKTKTVFYDGKKLESNECK